MNDTGNKIRKKRSSSDISSWLQDEELFTGTKPGMKMTDSAQVHRRAQAAAAPFRRPPTDKNIGKSLAEPGFEAPGEAFPTSRNTNNISNNAIATLQSVGLSYVSGVEILHDINLYLKAGSFYFLSGASGAGKSSLLSLLYLARKPSRGSLSLFGQDAATMSRNERSAIRRKIGVVFQDSRLLDHLTLFDNVALPLRIARENERNIMEFVTDLLAWVGLRDQAGSYPPFLSGGQQQAAAIARALVARPKLLLADEPTGNLDDRLASRLLELFKVLNKDGTTIVIASHNPQLIRKLNPVHIHLEGRQIRILDSETTKNSASGKNTSLPADDIYQ